MIDAITLDLHKSNARAVVDPGLENLLLQTTWRLDEKTRHRPRAFTHNTNGKFPNFPERLYLERLISQAPSGRFIRFRNLNTLDCRTANLEVVDVRSDVSRDDLSLRQAWIVQEGVTHQTAPERRRLESWRMWCEGYSVKNIVNLLRCDGRDIWADIKAMAADPMAGAPVEET